MSHRVAVYLVLRSGADVLFMLRAGTGYRDGEYGLPSGKVDGDEGLVAAIVREADEELGVRVAPAALRLVHVTERRAPGDSWLDFFFECDEWDGAPVNAEPHKCGGLAWVAPHAGGVIDYVADVLDHIDRGIPFSLREKT